MNIDQSLRLGAYNAVRICMNVEAKDRVYIFTDDETFQIGQALADEAQATGAVVRISKLADFAPRPFRNIPEALIRDVEEFAPTVTFFAARAQEGELAFRIELGMHLIQEMRVRHGHMVSITPRIMQEGMRADYHQVFTLTNRVYDLLRTAKTIHVTSKKGSDLTATFSPGLKWVPCHGLYHQAGQWGNLPEGEVYTCPATVNGLVVADVLRDYFSPKYGILSSPMTFDIKDSFVQQVQCKDKTIETEVLDYLNSSENGKRVGEFAIGTNTAIKELTGNLLQDEKIPGIHIAFGNPYPRETGADWTSNVHIDVIPTECAIEVDGKMIMRDGEFLSKS